MRLVWAKVVSAEPPREGSQELLVDVSGSEPQRAMAYTQLTGSCGLGDTVLVNTTAVDLSLGTGGIHFVVAKAPAGTFIPSGHVELDSPSGGHVMKLRYTPLQVDVNAVEEPDGGTYGVMRTVTSVEEMPVVCCGLHSQMPLAAAAIKERAPQARVAYCHTDFGSLPYALSNVARECRQAGLVDAAISCGQAFGADLEAVNLHSGLLAAKHVAGADIAIVAIGPGMVGTATPFGHGGGRARRGR